MISTCKIPMKNDRLPASNPSVETLNLLSQRRSLTVKDMTLPGPDRHQIEQILTIGSRVPDHKKQVPWRFLTIEGDDRKILGKISRDIFCQNNPACDPGLANFEEGRLMRAPLIITVISTASDSNEKTPEWEQILSAGAVCQNILIAAAAMGFASQWLTEWYAYDPQFLTALGLSSDERIAGFIYIGTAQKDPRERARPDVKKISQKWTRKNE